MPRFFFDVEIDGTFHQDRSGLTLPDLESAKHVAERNVLSEIGDHVTVGEESSHEVVHVRGEDGSCLLRLPFSAFRRVDGRHDH